MALGASLSWKGSTMVNPTTHADDNPVAQQMAPPSKGGESVRRSQNVMC